MNKFLKDFRLRLEYSVRVTSVLDSFSDRLKENLPDKSKMLASYEVFRHESDFEVEPFLRVTTSLYETGQFERFSKIPKDLRLNLKLLNTVSQSNLKDLGIILDCFDLTHGEKHYWMSGDDFNSSGVSKELAALVRNRTYLSNSRSYSAVITVAYVLKETYGDQFTVDFMKRYEDEVTDYRLSDLPKLLKNWEDYKDYPLSWAQAMLE